MAAAAVLLPCSCGAEGMGEGSRGCLAGAGKRKRPERMGWQASGWMREGSTSGRQARAAVGVCVCGACLVCACACACAFGGGGGESSPFFQDWSQSLPRNMRGPGEGKGRGREIPPSPVTLGTIECLEAILLKNQLSLPTAHAPKSMCQEGQGRLSRRR